MSWLPTSTVTGTRSAWIHWQAAANSRRRARMVRSPVIASASGFSSLRHCAAQASARGSSSPKGMSLKWKMRIAPFASAIGAPALQEGDVAFAHLDALFKAAGVALAVEHQLDRHG